MFRGRAALRVFGIDSFANDAGTRPCQWILGRISRARKGHSSSVFPFLCVVREPTVGAHENLAGWSLPVRALRKRLTRAFQQRRARAKCIAFSIGNGATRLRRAGARLRS